MKHDHKVIFEAPSPRTYSAIGINSVDMHIHTNFSDSMSTVQNVLKVAEEQKIGIAITDHNEIRGAILAHKNSKKLLLIPGIEVSAGDGPHILLYFYSFSELETFFKRYILSNRPKNPNLAISLSTEEILDYANDYNSLKVAAHPFGYGFTNTGIMKCVNKKIINKSIIRKFDAMEAICGGIPHESNIKSTMYALNNNKPITGGTDSHVISQIGNTLTISEADNSVENFLNNILDKKNIVVGKETLIRNKVRPGIGIGIKHLKYPFTTLVTQIKTHANKFKKTIKKTIK